MHAGGVLIAPGKLTDFCPLYTQPGSDALVSQFDKDDVELVGLVKFDFLGLTTLTILDWTLRYIRKLDPASTLVARDAAARRQGRLRHFQERQHDGGVPVRIARHARAAAAGAAEALRRHRRAGRAVPAGADGADSRLRAPQAGHRARRVSRPAARADPGADLRRDGVSGAGDADRAGRSAATRSAPPTCCGARWARSCPRKWPSIARASLPVPSTAACPHAKATQLFDLMEKFAGYGFNKSHAAAYALIAYQTAYFKAHHPAAFMAANLSLVMDDTDKLRQFYDDAVALGLDDAAAGRQCVELPLRAGRRAAASATVSAASRAPDGPRSKRSSPRASRRPVHRSVRFLPARRQARRQPARHRGADPCRRLRRHRSAARQPARVGRRRARPRASRRDRAASQVSLFGEARSTRDSGAGTYRHARMDRDRTSGPGEGEPRLLPVGPSRISAYAEELAGLVQQPLGALKPTHDAGAHRRRRHAVAHANVAPRQDGVRDARRRQRSAQKSSSSTRPSIPIATCCARTRCSSPK